MISENGALSQVVPNSMPPCNTDIEEAILGGILLDPDAFSVVKEIPTKAFFVRAHQIIFSCAKRLHEQGHKTDLMNVATALQDSCELDIVGGSVKLASLLDRTVSAVNIDRYAALIIEKYRRRQFIEFGHELIAYSHDTSVPISGWLDRASLVFNQLKSVDDEERAKFNSLIDAIKRIETYIDDPALRHLKKKALAKDFGLQGVKELDHLFMLHISNRERIPMMNFAELKDKYGADVQKWLVGGIFPANSFNLIDAYGGCGKTLLMYDLALHLLNGTPWNGLPVTNLKERRILIIQADESPGATVNALRDRIPDGEENIQFLPGWDLNQLGHLEKEIESFRPCFILVDSLTAINRDSGLDENSASYVSRLKGLHLLCQNYEATVCVIHHSNKNGQYRGSTAIPAAFDQHFSLRRPTDTENQQDCRRILTIEKSRYRSPESYELELEPDTKSWKLLGKVSASMDLNKPMRDRLVEYLTECRGVPLSPVEIADQLGGNWNTVRKELNILSSEGIIGRKKAKFSKGNVYFITDDCLEEGLYDFTPQSDPSDPSDLEGDQLTDHLSKPDSVKVSTPSDPLIRNSAEKSTTPKTFENADQWITSPPNSNNHEGLPSDPPSDPSDPHPPQRITSFSIGDRVIYKGNDKGKQQVCLRRHLEVLEIKGELAVVKHRKWVITHEIPLNDLQLIENRQCQ